MPHFPKSGADNGAFNMNIIISDITYMKDTFCIAGWSSLALQRFKEDRKVRVIECHNLA